MENNNLHIHKWEHPNGDLGEFIRTTDNEEGMVCRECGTIKLVPIKIEYKCVSRTGKHRCVCSDCRLWHILENFDGHGTCLYKSRGSDVTRFDMLCNETGAISK